MFIHTLKPSHCLYIPQLRFCYENYGIAESVLIVITNCFYFLYFVVPSLFGIDLQCICICFWCYILKLVYFHLRYIVGRCRSNWDNVARTVGYDSRRVKEDPATCRARSLLVHCICLQSSGRSEQGKEEDFTWPTAVP